MSYFKFSIYLTILLCFWSNKCNVSEHFQPTPNFWTALYILDYNSVIFIYCNYVLNAVFCARSQTVLRARARLHFAARLKMNLRVCVCALHHCQAPGGGLPFSPIRLPTADQNYPSRTIPRLKINRALSGFKVQPIHL